MVPSTVTMVMNVTEMSLTSWNLHSNGGRQVIKRKNNRIILGNKCYKTTGKWAGEPQGVPLHVNLFDEGTL